MKFYVYNDSVGVGRRYWNDEKRQWVMAYELPTAFDSKNEAENAIATFLMMHPGLVASESIGVEDCKGKIWT